MTGKLFKNVIGIALVILYPSIGPIYSQQELNKLPDLEPKEKLDAKDEIILDGPIIDSLYIIGPGDELDVYIGKSKKYLVGPQGYIQIADAPSLFVGNTSLRDAHTKIKEALSNSYDTSKIYVNLSNTKKFKYYLLGEVVKPGAKEAKGLIRVSDVITDEAGFTVHSVRDTILKISPLGDTTFVDLNRYYKTFKDADNPLINIGDKVVVHTIDFNKEHCFFLYGERVFYHEIDPSLTISDVFLHINDYEDRELPLNVKIISNGRIKYDTYHNLMGYVPQDKDSIELIEIQSNVYVGGAVTKAGQYEYIATKSAFDYIYEAGIDAQSAAEQRCFLIRGNERNLIRDLETVKIKPGDKLLVKRRTFYHFSDYLAVLASITGIITSTLTLIIVISQQ